MEEQLWYGKYQPLGLLQASNGTEVFQVYHVGLEEERILKRAEKGTRAEAVLRRELHMLRKAAGLNVPRLLDYEESKTELVIIEEFLPGDTLASYLRLHTEISVERIRELVLSICEILLSLQNCIEGFVHCDLQPANLIVRGERLMLIDFGAAFSTDFSGVGSSYGTKGFCAPEQEGGEGIDERTDVFALGKLISHLLGFAAGTPSFSDRRLKRQLEVVANKASKTDPAERYQTVFLLKEELKGGRDSRKVNRPKKLPKQSSVCTIGIAGTHHGVGVTQTALSMAWYLSNIQKKKVAVIDLSESKALSCFDSSGKDLSPCLPEGFYVFPEADSLQVSAVRNRDFDYCILDLGCAANRRMHELLRCDKKLIMSDSAPWRTNRKGIIDGFVRQIVNPDGWWLVLNLSGRSCPREYKKLPLPVVQRQYSEDLYDTSIQNEKLYVKILSAN